MFGNLHADSKYVAERFRKAHDNITSIYLRNIIFNVKTLLLFVVIIIITSHLKIS